MKLEIKHLAPYLPYGLKCHAMGMHTEESIYTDKPTPIEYGIKGLNIWRVELLEGGKSVTIVMHYEDTFPILRPMSDLTKEIIFQNENVSGHFVPMEVLGKSFKMNVVEFGWLSANAENSTLLIETIRHCVIQKLFEWKFDVFGLIKECLAIDINTI